MRDGRLRRIRPGVCGTARPAGAGSRLCRLPAFLFEINYGKCLAMTPGRVQLYTGTAMLLIDSEARRRRKSPGKRFLLNRAADCPYGSRKWMNVRDAKTFSPQRNFLNLRASNE